MARKPQTPWYGLYQSLQPKIEGHQGDESIYELIRSEAEAASYDEKVLKRMLNAGAYLERIADTPLTIEQVKCGYAHLELLERIQKLNAEAAQERFEAVLNNKVTIRELREVLDSMISEAGNAHLTARSRARQRIAEHQRLSLQLAQRMGPGFFGSPKGEMVLVKSFRALRQFILIHDPEQPPIAVIPRVGNSSLKEESAAEELLNLAISVQAYFQRVWVVLPEKSRLADELISRAMQIGAFDAWLHVATPNDDASALIVYRNTVGALYKDMEGSDDCKWEGISLRDGRELGGTLKPIGKTDRPTGSSNKAL